MTAAPSVVLVEDHKLLRLGLKIALEKLGCCQVSGEVEDGEAAVREALKLRPDVVLMDIGLPGIDGIEATWRIKQEVPRTRVIMFTSHTTPDDVTAALGAGADGYCSKETAVEQIASAIAAVMRGEIWLDPAIADVVVRCHSAAGEQTGVALGNIETQILALISEGIDNRDIAIRLNRTTESLARVMQKIIHRFVERSPAATSIQHNQQRRTNEWLTACVDTPDEGTIFADKYLVQNALGSGGMGSVFKAKHLYMDRDVALKLLRSELTEDPLAIRNFQREAMAIANLQHKNIVSVYDFGISLNREPFLIMEYINGTTLEAVLEKEHRLPVRRLVNLCVQVCAGLAEAHAKGIVHCDLKPSNILILGCGPDETVKLADFGLAQIIPRAATTQSQLTDKFYICGTPLYISPEQCAGKPVDPLSDIYSLGCILYEALTGVKVFDAETIIEIFAKQCQFIPPPLSIAYPEGQFPPQLEQCVSRMLAKDPAERPQSMDVVRTLLLSILG